MTNCVQLPPPPPPESLSASEIASGILHIYEVKVHLKNPAIKKEGNTDPEEISDSLKSLIVTASLVYSEGIKYKATGEPCNIDGESLTEELPVVQPISYFTLVNHFVEPINASPLWVSTWGNAIDGYKNMVLSFNPITKELTEKFEIKYENKYLESNYQAPLFFKPGAIALHPYKNRLAVGHDDPTAYYRRRGWRTEETRGLSVFNLSKITKKGELSYYKDVSRYNNDICRSYNAFHKNDRDNLLWLRHRLGKVLLFRPDGKRLFCNESYHTNFDFCCIDPFQNEAYSNPQICEGSSGLPFHAGADGYIYTIHIRGGNILERFSMYAPNFSTAKAPDTGIKYARDVVTTPDGRYVIVKRFNDNYTTDLTLDVYESSTLKLLKRYDWIDLSSTDIGNVCGMMGISSNGRWLLVTDGVSKCYLFDLQSYDITQYPRDKIRVYQPPAGYNNLLAPDDAPDGYHFRGPVVYMPDQDLFAFPYSRLRRIMVVKATDSANIEGGLEEIATITLGICTGDYENIDDVDGVITDIAANPVQYITVCDTFDIVDGNPIPIHDEPDTIYFPNHVRHVDVYTHKVMPNISYRHYADNIAVPANDGAVFSALHRGANQNHVWLHLFPGAQWAYKGKCVYTDESRRPKQVITFNEPLYRTATSPWFAVRHDQAYSIVSGHWPSADETPTTASDTRQFSDGWNLEQILPLYHGGCLVLGRKGNDSFIEWVGKVPEWASGTSPVLDADKKPGEYMRFATWLNVDGTQQISFDQTKTWPDNLPDNQKNFTADTHTYGQELGKYFRIKKQLPKGCTIDKIFYNPYNYSPESVPTFRAVVYEGDDTLKYKSQVLSADPNQSATSKDGIELQWCKCDVTETPCTPDIQSNYYVGVMVEGDEGGSEMLLFRMYTVNNVNYQTHHHSWGDYNDKAFYFEITTNNSFNVAATFPPRRAKKMAVSADDKILAITADAADKVYFYDLSVFDYGPLIQPKGIVELQIQDGDIKKGPIIATCAAYFDNPPSGPLNKNLLNTKKLEESKTAHRFGYFQSPWAKQINKLEFIDPSTAESNRWLQLIVNEYTVYNTNKPQPQRFEMPGGLTVPMQFIADAGYNIVYRCEDEAPHSFEPHIFPPEVSNEAWSASSSFLAFKHEPVLIAATELKYYSYYKAENIAFNKDIANPTLYLSCKKGDTTPKIAKLDPFARFSGPTDYSIDETSPLVFTPDGQNIAYLYKKGGADVSTLHFYDINDKIATAVIFADDVPIKERLINPTLIAAKPFNTYKSTGGKGQLKKETIQTTYAQFSDVPGQYKAAMLDGTVYLFAAGDCFYILWLEHDKANNKYNLCRGNSFGCNENVISALTYDNNIYLVRGTETDRDLEIDYFDPDSKEIKLLYKDTLQNNLYVSDSSELTSVDSNHVIAACTSPFGIIILTVVQPYDDSEAYVYKVYLYMPHGVDSNFTQPNKNGCLVLLGQSPYYAAPPTQNNMWWGNYYNYIGDATILWHKGYLYIMPGEGHTPKSDNENINKIGRIRCSSPQELQQALKNDCEGTDSHEFNFAPGFESYNGFEMRGACSFGNDIFIVGGEDSECCLYNPDLTLGSDESFTPTASDSFHFCGSESGGFSPSAALPCGSRILIFSESGCKYNYRYDPYFYRFTP